MSKTEVKREIILSNGVAIPSIGYGTWQTPDGEECVNATLKALSYGYRHIDTAAIYRNETSVGEAVKKFGIAREDIFITSKVWNKCRGYDMVMSAFERTLGKLGVDYLDLYLIHWPASKKQYENPVVEIELINQIDVLTCSNFADCDCDDYEPDNF